MIFIGIGLFIYLSRFYSQSHVHIHKPYLYVTDLEACKKYQ